MEPEPSFYLATSMPSPMTGLQALQPRAGAIRCPWVGGHCTRHQGLLPHYLSHLELSRPCDLRKFLSRFLDKNATSSSFVLVREGICVAGLSPCPRTDAASPNDLYLFPSFLTGAITPRACPLSGVMVPDEPKEDAIPPPPLLSEPALRVQASGSSSPFLIIPDR